MDSFQYPEKILQNFPVGVVVTDADWRVRYVNRILARTMGSSAEQMLGVHLCVLASRFCHQDSHRELLHHLVHLTLSPPQEVETKMVPVQTPEKKFIRVTAQAYCPEETFSGYLLFFSDATREGNIDEMKSEFISVASHEIRTPMTSIKGSLELLLGGYAGELPLEASELLGICLTAVDRLIRLINDLLDIAKIESGKMELNMDRLNLTDCIKKSLRSIRSLAEAQKVSIDAEPSGQIPDVYADRDRLEQVITNLLSNALKYAPPESIVRVHVQEVNNSVRVSVADRGPGIPPEQVEKGIDRFHQLEGAKKGTGLGLTICRALIEQQRGRIWVESEPGQGANFQFELPALSAD